MKIDDRNKTITAYHESGHAIVAYYTKDAMPINKATIMARGPTLGHVRIFKTRFRICLVNLFLIVKKFLTNAVPLKQEWAIYLGWRAT